MCMIAQKDGPEKQSIQKRMVFMYANRKKKLILKSASTF